MPEPIVCKTTGRTLFDSKGKPIEACGQCVECKEWFAEELLATAPGMDPSKWPVVHQGLFCTPCHEKR